MNIFNYSIVLIELVPGNIGPMVSKYFYYIPDSFKYVHPW